MSPTDLPPSGAPLPDDLDWELIDRYLAGAATPDEAHRAQAQLQDAARAGIVVETFLDTVAPASVAPTVVEKADGWRALHAAAITPHTPARRVWRGTSSWLRLAAASLVLVAGGYVIMRSRPTTVKNLPQQTYATHRGERAVVHLADGSTVTLGAHSTLRHNVTFGARDRTVYLEGEAYFTVSHQAKAPFIVRTARTTTQVLGTEFLVKAYPGDSIARIAVVGGKIAVRDASRGTAPVTMTVGDLAELGNAGRIAVTHNVAMTPYTSWTRGQLTLTRTTLGQVIPDLERWYDITIELRDPSLARAALSVALDTDSADQAMALLSDALDLTWTRHGKTVTLAPAARRR